MWGVLEVFMQAIGSMLRRTSHQLSRQRELFALRARKATGTLTAETRDASQELGSAVRAEALAWRKYVQESATVATGNLAPHALERTVLLRVSLVLRALDARLRDRLGAIEARKRAPRSKSKLANGARKARSRRQATHAVARAN
jgi:hypothetical protein